MGKLSDTKCRTVKTERAKVTLADGAGLYLEVRKSGAKTWLYRYMHQLRAKWLIIGPYGADDPELGVYSVAGARMAAQSLALQRRAGVDPAAQRAVAKAAAEEAQAAAQAASAAAARAENEHAQQSLRALLESYLEHLRKTATQSTARSAESIFRNHVYAAYPQYADAYARDLTPRHAIEMQRRLVNAGKERTADVLRAYMSAAYAFALAAEYDARAPSAGLHFGIVQNPISPTRPGRVNAGTRHLSPAELGLHMRSLSASVIDKALALATLAGGQRIEQLVRAEIADYDIATGTLRLWDDKGRRTKPREHLLPLGPRARALVEDLIAVSRELAPPGACARWIMTTTGQEHIHATTLSKRAHDISAAACAQQGVAPYSCRDLRRTVETQMAALKIDKEVRAHVQSHGLGGVQDKHYQRHDFFEEKKAALERWEAAVTNAEKAESTLLVLPAQRGPRRPTHVTGRKSRAQHVVPVPAPAISAPPKVDGQARAAKRRTQRSRSTA